MLSVGPGERFQELLVDDGSLEAVDQRRIAERRAGVRHGDVARDESRRELRNPES